MYRGNMKNPGPEKHLGCEPKEFSPEAKCRHHRAQRCLAPAALSYAAGTLRELPS